MIQFLLNQVNSLSPTFEAWKPQGVPWQKPFPEFFREGVSRLQSSSFVGIFNRIDVFLLKKGCLKNDKCHKYPNLFGKTSHERPPDVSPEVLCLKESRKLLAYLEKEFGKAPMNLVGKWSWRSLERWSDVWSYEGLNRIYCSWLLNWKFGAELGAEHRPQSSIVVFLALQCYPQPSTMETPAGLPPSSKAQGLCSMDEVAETVRGVFSLDGPGN